MFPSKTSFTSYFAVVLDGKTINLWRETRPDSYWSSFPSVDEIPVQDVFPVRLNTQTERCFAVRSQPAKSRERRKEVKNNQEKNSGLKETEANLKMDVFFKHNIHLGKVSWKLGNLTSVNPEETISNGTQFYQRVISNIRITRNQYEKSWLNSLLVEITQKLFIRRPCLPKEAFFVLPQMLRCSFLKQVFFSSPLKT